MTLKSFLGWIAAGTGRRMWNRRAFVPHGEGGSVSVTMGVVLVALLGMTALGTEMTFVLYKQRQMQSVADAAALSTALAITKGYPASFTLEARAVAASGGFVHGVDGAEVIVNTPPLFGAHAGISDAVEVIVRQPQTLTLVTLLTTSAFNVTSRAVAMTTGGGTGEFCILTTDTTASTSVTINNGARAELDECGLAVNSTGSRALSVSGGARLEAKSVTISGQARVNNGGRITATDGVNENQPPMADPYADVELPAPSGCDYNYRQLNWSSSVQQITPGTYCNGLKFANAARVSMAPGIYYIKSGQFNLAGGTKVTGTGVTIVLTRNTGNYATVTIGNGSDINLTAPTTGVNSGLLLYSDRNAPNSGTANFEGGATMKLTGALYFPTQKVVFSNNSSNSSTCTQLIAWRLEMKGGSRISNDCSEAGVKSIGAGASAGGLVE